MPLSHHLHALGQALRRTCVSGRYPLRLVRQMHRRQPQRALAIALLYGSLALSLALMCWWGLSLWAWLLWAVLAGQAVARWVREESGSSGAMAEVVAATEHERRAHMEARLLRQGVPKAQEQTRVPRKRL